MAGPNMDLFDAYFRRADLDQDGRINGAEAVAFFQGSNLPKNVLAQIWMHADQSHSGSLGRAEFYNALKLVTVAQSKRDLTPEIVKAALYGPASAKIPAPQINFAPSPAPQLNAVAASSATQAVAVAPAASQNLGFRGQVPPNQSMNQHLYPSQGNQSARPHLPVSTGTAPRPSQSAAGPGFPRGGSMVSPGLSNSSISSDRQGGRTGGATAGATSPALDSGISQSTPSSTSKQQDLLSLSSLTAIKDSKASVSSGNGFPSEPVFGGDVFSVTPSLQKHDSSVPTYSATGALASSASVPASTGLHSSAKTDPLNALQSAFMPQSVGGQLQPVQSQVKQNQQVASQTTSSPVSLGTSVEVGNSTSNHAQPPWPKMTPAAVQKYMKVFMEVDNDRDGKITGEQARNLFLSWRLPREVLKQVWDLSDQDSDSMLSLREFCVALYLMERYREGRPLPPTLPSNVLLDETLLSLTRQPNASYGHTAWGPTSGLRPQQGMHVAQPITPSSGLRPPLPSTVPRADAAVHFNQHKARIPSMENSHMNQVTDGEQTSLNLNSQVVLEAEKKVEDKEKVILDSKEKIDFYRTKMQDLVLYKSRCDNRLNEITERALADKREAELLGKKYEEKYKQVAEVASKLTIEEATFRDIQERKMELQQAIIKMDQGGSADGILQVRADRIQSDLEELMKALTERCKKHGIDVKSTTLIELPPGWEPGVPLEAAIWDEDWDKFEDEGFSFDVMPPKTKSAAVQKEKSSPVDVVSPNSMSNVDDKSEAFFAKGDHTLEGDSTYTPSEDELAKSPSGSPVRRSVFESPSKEYSDNHFRKGSEADRETNRSYDDSTWGTFDNNDDTDSVWGFGISARDLDHEKNGEKYFFGSGDLGISSIRTDSPQADSMSQKKSPFTFEDSVPSTPLSRTGHSPPRYSVGSTDHFFDNFTRFDSFSAGDHGLSPRQETLARFDSISSSKGFEHSQGFSSFDDSDPFGSTGPFKVSSETQNQRKGSENWSAF